MTIACPDCGLLEELPAPVRYSKAVCALCRTDLELTSGRSITAALACGLATFVLLFPTNLMPLLSVHAFGLRTSNLIGGGILLLWNNGWVLLAGLSAIFVVILPFIRFGLLSLVLGFLRLGWRTDWLGSAFRWAVWLDQWAMLDVFLLASFVGYYRLAHVSQLKLTIEPGGYCFVAAAFLTMLSRAALDKRTVWRAIGPEHPAPLGEPAISCTTCDLVQPLSCEGRPCPRCGATLHARKPDALVRTTALIIAAFILFFPANFYPMNVSTQLGHQQSYTIYTGIKDLFENDLWPLGIIIFCTSILIPFGKIVVIGWCVASVRLGSSRHLVLKTKLLRLIAELGRWSKTDPYTSVFFVPLMKLGAFASSDAGWGAIAFIAMTFLTMVASQTFDPRLMWDAARGRV